MLQDKFNIQVVNLNKWEILLTGCHARLAPGSAWKRPLALLRSGKFKQVGNSVDRLPCLDTPEAWTPQKPGHPGQPGKRAKS